MTGKVSILCLFFLLIGTSEILGIYKAGNCPLRHSIHKCTPICVSDHQCSSNEKCCPNKCGSDSCAIPSAVNTGSDGGYKSSRVDAVYCEGVKCLPSEKCEFDRRTKHQKCVRK